MFGPFASGVLLIKGLTQAEARDIHRYLTSLNPYSRVSSHGDLTNGVDLEFESQHITVTKDGGYYDTYRHVLFSNPKPYRDGDDLNSGESSIVDDSFTEDVYTDRRFEDIPFYLRIKPESYGTRYWYDFTMHSLSYASSRLNPWATYKAEAGYYGDGKSNMSKNHNGCFVVDVRSGYMEPWKQHAGRCQRPQTARSRSRSRSRCSVEDRSPCGLSLDHYYSGLHPANPRWRTAVSRSQSQILSPVQLECY